MFYRHHPYYNWIAGPCLPKLSENLLFLSEQDNGLWVSKGCWLYKHSWKGILEQRHSVLLFTRCGETGEIRRELSPDADEGQDSLWRAVGLLPPRALLLAAQHHSHRHHYLFVVVWKSITLKWLHRPKLKRLYSLRDSVFSLQMGARGPEVNHVTLIKHHPLTQEENNERTWLRLYVTPAQRLEVFKGKNPSIGRKELEFGSSGQLLVPEETSVSWHSL